MKTYEVYFSDCFGEVVNEEYLYTDTDLERAVARITPTLEEHQLKKAPYSRWSANEDGAFMDFGSWSKFIFIKNATMGELFNLED